MENHPFPKPTFYTDDDVDGLAIRIAKDQGVSIITSYDAGLLGADDPVHFRYAWENGYVLVTGNRRDYIVLFGEAIGSVKEYPGIVFIKPSVREMSNHIANYLRLFYEAGDQRDFQNRIQNIE
jgi:hypothetical protein